jgi:type IV pilus assembly protein PilV
MMNKLHKNQSGVMLLEALIGILIFSIGILAVIGLQAASISASTDAKYRSDASLLANKLIARMWVSNRTPAVLAANFQGGCSGCTAGAEYTRWLSEVTTSMVGVAGGYPPIVSVVPQTVGAFTVSSLVTITVQWKTPNQAASDQPHNYTVQLQIV